MRPAAVSNGGLFGTLGWLRVGVNDFVLSNEAASSFDSVMLRDSSNLSRSSFSFSLICLLKSFQRLLIAGMNGESCGLSF